MRARSLGLTTKSTYHHFLRDGCDSCLLADLVAAAGGDPAATLWALLHDDAEAYTIDLPYPLKHGSDRGAVLRAAEAPLQRGGLRTFALPSERPALLNAIDRSLLAAEKFAPTAPLGSGPSLKGSSRLTWRSTHRCRHGRHASFSLRCGAFCLPRRRGGGG